MNLRMLICLLVLSAVPVGAQSFKGHNGNAPVDFEADHLEAQDRADRVVVSGNVKVRQADLSLDTSRLTVAYARSDGKGTDIQRLDASGGVTVRTPSQTANSNFAIYDVNRRLITMLGGVTLIQGGNTVHGGRLVIDLASGRSVIDGSSVGGTRGTTTNSGGRVTGRFTVPQRNQ